MADSLIRDGHINFNQFWIKNGECHLYSGDVTKRKEAAMKIYTQYAQYYMNGLQANNLGIDHEDIRKKHLLSLMCRYFQVPLNDSVDNFSESVVAQLF